MDDEENLDKMWGKEEKRLWNGRRGKGLVWRGRCGQEEGILEAVGRKADPTGMAEY